MPERTGTARPGEFELIARYFAPLTRDFPGAFGLGDDTARFALPPGNDLVVTTDMLIAGIHFLADDPPASVAKKSLRVNLSDLAAAGAVPLAYQLSTAWPTDATEEWIAAFAGGLAEDQRVFGIALSGGDTAATPGPMTITVTAFGSVASGRGLGRAGARAGDLVMVSGTIGDGLLGLMALQNRLGPLPRPEVDHVVDRYRLPRPRSALGPRLPGLASACIDVSDGLLADLGHICERSGCGAEIDLGRIPLSSAARAAIDLDPDLLGRLIAAGDDYELLFAVPSHRRERAVADLATAEAAITEIGRFVEGSGVRVIGADGTRVATGVTGWQHF